MSHQEELHSQALEIAVYARARSPYYRALYRELPERLDSFLELPEVDRKAYWVAADPSQNRVATGPLSGLMIGSGGTTGAPKFTVYGPVEWELTRKAIGFGGVQAGLREGDRVANMGSAVEMYGSLLMNHGSLWHCPVNVLEFPIGDPKPPSYEIGSLEMIRDFKINVILATTSTVYKMAEYVLAEPARFDQLSVRTILCFGEALFSAQKELIATAFPGAHVSSAAHGATDAGPMGFADPDCDIGEHRRSPCALLQIVSPDSREIIEEPGIPGDLVVTNLVRRLMPVVRYPIGDRAEWVEPSGSEYRKYKLLGRTEANANLGGASIRFEELQTVVMTLLTRHDIVTRGMQVIITQQDNKDKMTIVLAAPELDVASRQELGRRLSEFVVESMDFIKVDIDAGYAHPIAVEWGDYADMTFNKRTGKLLPVVDRRYE